MTQGPQAGMPAIFGAAAEDVADLAIEAAERDLEVTRRLARLLVQDLADLLPDARPIGLNGLFKAVAKLAFWAMAADQADVTAILVDGIAAAPPDFVDAALDRMETLEDGLFWEVNERGVSVAQGDPRARAPIPAPREAGRPGTTHDHAPLRQDGVPPGVGSRPGGTGWTRLAKP